MYKLQMIDKFLCKRVCLSSSDSYKSYSIWYHNNMYPMKSFVNLFQRNSLCNPQIFPFVYWSVLILSMIGFIICSWEFLKIFHGTDEITTFRHRQIRVLSMIFRKNARLFGSAFMAGTYLLLFLGLITVSPSSMIPWMAVNGVSIIIEIIIWIFDIIANNEAFSLSTIISLILFAIFWFSTSCVKDVLEEAIEIDNVKEFKFFIGN